MHFPDFLPSHGECCHQIPHSYQPCQCLPYLQRISKLKVTHFPEQLRNTGVQIQLLWLEAEHCSQSFFTPKLPTGLTNALSRLHCILTISSDILCFYHFPFIGINLYKYLAPQILFQCLSLKNPRYNALDP